jgi:hypothetical protein
MPKSFQFSYLFLNIMPVVYKKTTCPFKEYSMRLNILLLLCLVSSNVMSAEINIHVSYPDGKPAQGIKVQAVGLDRGNMYNDLLGVTDNHGNINTEIIVKPENIPNDLNGYYSYLYRYVVMPENFRWEISDIYWARFPDDGTDFYENYLPGERNMSIGKNVNISQDTKIEWNVILHKSSDVVVSFRDQNNDPIKNMKLSLDLDLQANSHTGFGGEISIFDTSTDDKGDIKIHNPGKFFYSFELQYQRQYSAPDLNYFSATVIKRLESSVNIVRLHKCIGKQIEVIVKDKVTGEPVSGAILQGVMEFAGTTQGGPFGSDIVTDENGIYKSNNFCTDHLVEFGAYKEGYKLFLTDIGNFVPGSVNEFLLEPESK